MYATRCKNPERDHSNSVIPNIRRMAHDMYVVVPANGNASSVVEEILPKVPLAFDLLPNDNVISRSLKL
jgi:hypothetical protein